MELELERRLEEQSRIKNILIEKNKAAAVELLLSIQAYISYNFVSSIKELKKNHE